MSYWKIAYRYLVKRPAQFFFNCRRSFKPTRTVSIGFAPFRDYCFGVEDGAILKVSPPSWRSDIVGKADLVEEVIRIHGLNRVPSAPLTRSDAIAKPTLTPSQRRTRAVRRGLAARGFNETISFSFIPRAHAALFGGGDDARQLLNPITADLDALRPSVVPSLLSPL